MKLVILFWAVLTAAPFLRPAQNAAPPPGNKPTEHLIGTITAVDSASHTITVKEDKSGAEQTILLADTRTLIKVPPGAKDLKTASRITADQLAVGDRVDIRGNKSPDDPAKTAARSVVLMSGRDLQAAHEAQAVEWQNAPVGVVTSVDAAAGAIGMNERTSGGPKPVLLQTESATEFTRYSPEHPASPAASQLAAIQPGDQIRVIGDRVAGSARITARRVYSGAFRTVSGSVLSVAPDGKALTLRDEASKQTIQVALNDNSAIQKLPPEVAAIMAQRISGAARPTGAPAGGPPPGGGDSRPAAGGPPAGVRNRTGDLSRLLDRLPRITSGDLKPGEAVVVSGALAAAEGANHLVATHVIAGVEPLLLAAPARRGGNTGGAGGLGGDWGLGEMAIPQ